MNFSHGLRFASRRLRKSPGFAVTAIIHHGIRDRCQDSDFQCGNPRDQKDRGGYLLNRAGKPEMEIQV
jgi:hypothetical protein